MNINDSERKWDLEQRTGTYPDEVSNCSIVPLHSENLLLSLIHLLILSHIIKFLVTTLNPLIQKKNPPQTLKIG